jgi:hypothetical protein
MNDLHQNAAVQYTIRIKGQLPERWSVWFDGLSIAYTERDETLISGQFTDQAALHGLLAKIRDLNLTLISVNHEAEHEK